MSNRTFPILLGLFFKTSLSAKQGSWCKSFHMKMSSACSFIFMQIKVIFIRMVSHLDSLWNRGTREPGNCPLSSLMWWQQNSTLTEFYWPSVFETKESLTFGDTFQELVKFSIWWNLGSFGVIFKQMFSQIAKVLAGTENCNELIQSL